MNIPPRGSKCTSCSYDVMVAQLEEIFVTFPSRVVLRRNVIGCSLMKVGRGVSLMLLAHCIASPLAGGALPMLVVCQSKSRFEQLC